MTKSHTSQQTTPIPQRRRSRLLLVPILLILILLLGAILRFYQLGADGYGNLYYAATVKSMSASWHNFFYAAYEPGGSVSVDKPPLGFWLQVFSARLFGLNGFALALPQALAGVLSILVVFFLVKRPFGNPAGLTAALSLAIIPITVVTERNNTIDGTLVLVLLLAVWALLKSIRRGSFGYLLLSLFLVGIGFNIKMLQAYMILPAIYLTYLVAARQKWWLRLAHLGIATLLLVSVSLVWVAAFDLTPASERPYAGSSSENSMLELVVGHNGLARLEKLRPFSGLAGALDQPPGVTKPRDPAIPGNLPNRPQPGLPPRAEGLPPANAGPTLSPAAAVQPNTRQNEVGTAGLLRLFSDPLDDEASWLLILALLTIPVAGAVQNWRRPLDEPGTSWLVWTLWLIPMALYFSLTTGLWHTYYLIMLGPAIAALSGMAVWAAAKLLQRNQIAGWLATFLLVAPTLTYELATLNKNLPSAAWVIELAILLGIAGFTLIALKPAGTRKVALVCLVLTLALAPLAWSFASVVSNTSDSNLPHAGPAGNLNRPANTQVGSLNAFQTAVLEVTLANTESDSYLLAGSNANTTAPYILATGRPVLALGGFSGSDDIFSLEELVDMFQSGALRYMLLDNGTTQKNPELARWVRGNCQVVPLPGLRQPGQGQQQIPAGPQEALYDCGI
jgi:4-amino-4-deoxy-L-arabinose transferase-like glycosyltransferase